MLKELNSKREFVSKLSDKNGLPKWEFSMTSEKDFHNKNGIVNEDVLIIPLQEDDKNYLSSLLYVENPASASPTIYTVTNLELLDFVYNSNIDAHIRERILSTFLYFDNKIYESKEFAHLPTDLYAEIPVKEGETTKNFAITSSESTDPQGLHYNTICVTSNHCTRTYVCNYGSSCDHCLKECESVNCYTAGGGGYEGPTTGDGDTGNPGDPGGGTGSGEGDCSRGGWYRIEPPDGCGGGNTPPDPKCATTNASITNANNILKNPEVQTKMDAVLKSKKNAPVEYTVSVGKNNNIYNVTPPKEGDEHQGTIPPVLSGECVADGHTHPDGSYGTPSAMDLYNFILRFQNNPYQTTRFVYGSNYGEAEVYALVVYDKILAQNFINAYPKSTNYNTNTAMFLQTSAPGIAYKEAVDYISAGTIQIHTDEYYSTSAMATAYVLDRFNTGISLAKVDADGNLKRVNVTKEPIVVSNGTGVPKTGLKITRCP